MTAPTIPELCEKVVEPYPGQFRITWRNGGYSVSVPNYSGGEVVPVETVKSLEEYLARACNEKDAEITRLRAELAEANLKISLFRNQIELGDTEFAGVIRERDEAVRLNSELVERDQVKQDEIDCLRSQLQKAGVDIIAEQESQRDEDLREHDAERMRSLQ